MAMLMPAQWCDQTMRRATLADFWDMEPVRCWSMASGAFEHVAFEVPSFPKASIGLLFDGDWDGIASAVDFYREIERLVGPARPITIFDPIVVATGDRNTVIDHINSWPHGLTVKNQLIHEAVCIRSEVDLKAGQILSEGLAVFLRAAMTEFEPPLLAYGNVTYPALGILLENHEELSGDEMVFGEVHGEVFVGNKPLRLSTNIAATVVKICANFFIPKPMNTVDLITLAERHHDMSPQQTMSIAEELQNEGFVHYCREETRT